MSIAKPVKPKQRAQYIKQQRDTGQTLENIGRELGVTREAIRQILVACYGTADCCGAFISTADLLKLVPCSPGILHSLRHRGLIAPVAIGRWNADVVEKIRELRKCKVCGKPMGEGRLYYCSDTCQLKVSEHRYLRMSEEQKQHHYALVKRWRENHPNELRVINYRASKKWYMKHKASHPELVKEAGRRAYMKRKANHPEGVREASRRAYMKHKARQEGDGMCQDLTIKLPFLPPRECSPNARPDWRTKAKAVKQFRTDAFLCMVSERNKLRNFKAFDRCSIDVTFHVPDLRYVMDDDNARATLKAVQDSLVQAGIVNKNDRGVKVRSIGFIPYSEMAPAIVLEIHEL